MYDGLLNNVYLCLWFKKQLEYYKTIFRTTSLLVTQTASMSVKLQLKSAKSCKQIK